MAAVRPASVCTTIFGTPVVPEVSSTHSVRVRSAGVARGGAIAARRRRMHGNVERAGVGGDRRRCTIASISASAITARRCSASQIGRAEARCRRATPSSSISASAAVSWLAVATSTDRPAQFGEPAAEARAARQIGEAARSPSAPQKKRSRGRCRRQRSRRSDVASALRHFRRPSRSRRASPESMTSSDGGERIDAELVLEPRDQHGKARASRGRNRAAPDRRCSGASDLACSSRHLLHLLPLSLILSTCFARLLFVHSAAGYIPATLTIKFTTCAYGQREWSLPCRRSLPSDQRSRPRRGRRRCSRAAFPTATRRFWLRALRAAARAASRRRRLPQYGYLLESGGVPVGAILLICSTMPGRARPPAVRCNLSSWYVEPDSAAYAPLLVSQALRHKHVTYLNVSPAPHTWPIIEAQGFRALLRRRLRRACRC